MNITWDLFDTLWHLVFALKSVLDDYDKATDKIIVMEEFIRKEGLVEKFNDFESPLVPRFDREDLPF